MKSVTHLFTEYLWCLPFQLVLWKVHSIVAWFLVFLDRRRNCHLWLYAVGVWSLSRHSWHFKFILVQLSSYFFSTFAFLRFLFFFVCLFGSVIVFHGDFHLTDSCSVSFTYSSRHSGPGIFIFSLCSALVPKLHCVFLSIKAWPLLWFIWGN